MKGGTQRWKGSPLLRCCNQFQRACRLVYRLFSCKSIIYQTASKLLAKIRTGFRTGEHVFGCRIYVRIFCIWRITFIMRRIKKVFTRCLSGAIFEV